MAHHEAKYHDKIHDRLLAKHQVWLWTIRKAGYWLEPGVFLVMQYPSLDCNRAASFCACESVLIERSDCKRMEHTQSRPVLCPDHWIYAPWKAYWRVQTRLLIPVLRAVLEHLPENTMSDRISPIASGLILYHRVWRPFLPCMHTWAKRWRSVSASRESLNGTYDGMFPAPNAWTPFPERQKAKRTNNIKRKVVVLRAMFPADRGYW